eukprot:366538-Chlamydomonas_euryale.AAC.3
MYVSKTVKGRAGKRRAHTFGALLKDASCGMSRMIEFQIGDLYPLGMIPEKPSICAVLTPMTPGSYSANLVRTVGSVGHPHVGLDVKPRDLAVAQVSGEFVPAPGLGAAMLAVAR